MRTSPGTRRRARDERGVALPSPVVILSVIAIAMAGIAYVATQGGAPSEREVVAPAGAESSPGAGAAAGPGTGEQGRPKAAPQKKEKAPDPVKRGQVFVEVYNNSGITGLAGQVGGTVAAAGWKVAGTDNWYGSVPATTVYFPPALQRAGKQLALDLGVERRMPAVDPMREDRLTVVLTAPLG